MFVIRDINRKSVCQFLKHVKYMSSVPNKRIGIIGCPFSKGQQLRGPELAPQGEVKHFIKYYFGSDW